MKLIYAILGILAISQFGCSKKNEPAPIPEPEEYIKWKIGSKDYEITSLTKPNSTSTPAPVLFAISDNNSATSTIDAINFNPDGGEFYLTFYSNTPGQYPSQGVSINIKGFGVGDLIGVQNSLTFNIIELGAIGESIKGTLSGKLTTVLSPGPQYDFSAAFKVKNGE